VSPLHDFCQLERSRKRIGWMRFEPAKEGFYDLVLKIQNRAIAAASITAKRSARESKKTNKKQRSCTQTSSSADEE
jgi:hypothetical protein